MTRFLDGIGVRQGLRAAAVMLLVLFSAQGGEVFAQGNGFARQSVGGVLISPEGVLGNAQPDDSHRIREAMLQSLSMLNNQPADIKQPAELRKVSLRALQAALKAKLDSNQPLADDMRFLAGLQSIRYVFVYPERQDVVIAGFGEGWRVDDRGFVVGQTTNRPVLLLDDLVVALRTSIHAKGQPISCSIDPTRDGIQRLQTFVKTLTTAGNNREALENAIEQQLGPQTISISGVQPTSHLARVLVAADYRMKRIAMALDRSPVSGLPSYVQMISGGGRALNNMLPRWWLTTDYAPLLHDNDKLAWELSGPRVKAMSEEDRLEADGTVKRGVQRGGLTQKWADLMSEKYPELALKDPIFGQLRGVMDLTIVSALLTHEGLAHRAALNLDVFSNQAPVDEFFTPTQVPTIAHSLNKGSSVVISASGGVDIQPSLIIQRQEASEKLSPLRAVGALKDETRWWWN